MRITLDRGMLLSYVLQGLFHRSRRERKVYWHIYSALYLGAADALLTFYPGFGELTDERNIFDCHPLQAFI